MDQLDQIIRVIKIVPEDRSIQDVDLLIQLTKDIQFFKYYIEQNRPEIHKKCCRFMVFEQHPNRNIVFNIGTIVYSQNNLRFLSQTARTFNFLKQKGINSILFWKERTAPTAEQQKLMIRKPINIIQKAARKLKDQNYQLGTENSIVKGTSSLGDIFQAAYKKQMKLFRQQSLKLNRYNSVDSDFVCVSTLKAGSSFGELALINDRPRLATIVCKSNCKFAVLDKDNFQRILKEQEEIKLLKALTLYRSIPLFENFSTNLLKALHQQSFRVKYKLNEKVFAQGDVSEYLYIVYSGEFLLYQKFDQSEKTEQEQEESDNIIAESYFTSQRVKQQQKQKSIQKTQNYIEGTDVRIALLLPFQLLGEEDVYEGTTRSYNVICTSPEGELLRIKQRDYKQKILNDEWAKQYLSQNVPKKRKMISDLVIQKKTTLLNNMQFITQRKQSQSLQNKLQNGELKDATFLSQKLSVPSSQVQKQNYFQTPQHQSSPKKYENDKLLKNQTMNTSHNDNLSTQAGSNKLITLGSKEAENFKSIAEFNTTQFRNKSIPSLISLQPQNTLQSQQDTISSNQFISLQSTPQITAIRPQSSIQENKHNVLKDYFLNVGDPLLKGCFQEDLKEKRQTYFSQKDLLNPYSINKSQQMQQQSRKNPKNHSYSTQQNILNQPLLEDYVQANGNIRQVVKYRNPSENTVDFILKSNPRQNLPLQPQKQSRTITFLPTQIDETSPASNQKDPKTMQDLGPADLGKEEQFTPKGILSARLQKMHKMIRQIDKSNTKNSQPFMNFHNPISGPQSSLIKYKGISVNTFTNFSQNAYFQTSHNLSKPNIRTNTNQDSIVNEKYKSKTENHIFSIPSLKDIEFTSPIRLQQNQNNQNSNPSQNNLITSYFENTEDMTTEMSKNSFQIGQSSKILSHHKKSHDRVHLSISSARSDQKNIKTEQNSNQFIQQVTPFSAKNASATKIISEGSKLLKEISKGYNSTIQFNNKISKGRNLIQNNNFIQPQIQAIKSKVIKHVIESPQKVQNQSNKKRVVISTTNLNIKNTQSEIATQTEVDSPIKLDTLSNVNFSNINELK